MIKNSDTRPTYRTMISWHAYKDTFWVDTSVIVPYSDVIETLVLIRNMIYHDYYTQFTYVYFR